MAEKLNIIEDSDFKLNAVEKAKKITAERAKRAAAVIEDSDFKLYRIEIRNPKKKNRWMMIKYNPNCKSLADGKGEYRAELVLGKLSNELSDKLTICPSHASINAEIETNGKKKSVRITSLMYHLVDVRKGDIYVELANEHCDKCLIGHWSTKKISFTAEGENCVADRVILYQPGLEVFLSCLHPKASLYEKVTTRKKVKEASNNFIEKLNDHSIKVHNVRDVLKENAKKLLDLAQESLKYNIINDDEKEEKESVDHLSRYTGNEYKMEILEGLIIANDLDSLIDIIICQPEIGISSCRRNTGLNIEYIKCKPVGNMVFCRDQQITTNRGVIIGHLNSKQREFETKIMKLVFDNLNIKIIAEVPSDCYLEGGDFLPINNDLCLLGVGLRTNMKAAHYLMNNNLLGTDRFAVVVDKYDQNQDRMHLDTVFNVINHDTVIMLDFDSVPQESNNEHRNINRTVIIYEQNDKLKYKLIKRDVDFETFLRNEGFKNIIKVSHEQQLEYIINFLNIGNKRIIAVNKDLKKVIDDHEIKGLDINVEYVEFSGIKAMYGAAHCATQVSRIPSSRKSSSSKPSISTATKRSCDRSQRRN